MITIKVGENELEEIKAGRATRVVVNEEHWGVNQLVIIGLRPGVYEKIEKVVEVAESASTLDVNLSFIRENSKKTREEGQIGKGVDDGKSSGKVIIPKVDNKESVTNMKDFIGKQNQRKS